jgi:hypothetical protein
MRQLQTQMSSINQVIAQLITLKVTDKLKDLNAFDDLFERLSMVTEINKAVENNSIRIDAVETTAINGVSSIRMDIGTM